MCPAMCIVQCAIYRRCYGFKGKLLKYWKLLCSFHWTKNASQLIRDGKIFVEAFLKAYNLHLNWILTLEVRSSSVVKVKQNPVIVFFNAVFPCNNSMPNIITKTRHTSPHLKCYLWLPIIGYFDLRYSGICWGT